MKVRHSFIVLPKVQKLSLTELSSLALDIVSIFPTLCWIYNVHRLAYRNNLFLSLAKHLEYAIVITRKSPHYFCASRVAYWASLELVEQYLVFVTLKDNSAQCTTDTRYNFNQSHYQTY